MTNVSFGGYHTKCQAIPKPAHDALVRYKCLSWLCDKCKELLRGVSAPSCPNNDQVDLARLESKLQEVGDAVRNHMTMIVQSVKEQEKVVTDSTRLVERVCKDQHSQKASYADMVRGSCDKMIKEVSSKIESLPAQATKDTSEASRTMSNVFDSFMDKEKRKLNVVVHNLPETNSPSLAERAEKDQELFMDIIKEGLNLIVRPSRSFRVGKRLDDKPRLLVVSLENADTKFELLKMAPQLRHLNTWKRIYITPDQTKTEREESKRLREELASRRQAGEANIMIKRGRIVKAPAAAHSATAGEPGLRKHSAPSTSTIPTSTPNSRAHSMGQAVSKIPITAASSGDIHRPSDNPSASSIAPVTELSNAAPPAIPVPEPRQPGKDMTENSSAGSSQD